MRQRGSSPRKISFCSKGGSYPCVHTIVHAIVQPWLLAGVACGIDVGFDCVS